MFCSQLGSKSPWTIRLIILVAFGSLSLLLQCYSDFTVGVQWRMFRKWSDAELCRVAKSIASISANASKSAGLERLPSEEFYIRMLTARSPPRQDAYDPQASTIELRAKLTVLWKFLDACEQHNVQAMMYGGTLLGSYRHHGVIPWDSDPNLLVNTNDKAKLRKALNGKPDLLINTGKGAEWIVSNQSACSNKTAIQCRPPFVDVSFYEMKDGWVKDLANPKHRYPASITFPLHKRPFMGRWVNSPKDTLKFLSIWYKPTDLCTSLRYLNKSSAFPTASPNNINCKKLASTYPFVIRVQDSYPSCRGAIETLRFSTGGPVFTVPVNEPMGVINADYSLL